MRVISSTDLIPGLKVAKDVLTKHGSIFLANGTVLTDHMIDKINYIGIPNVFVHDGTENDEIIESQSKETVRPDIQEFTDKYQQGMLLTGELLDSIASGKKFSMELVREIADVIYDQVMSTNNILGRLMLQRNENVYINKHSLNVAFLSGMIGKWMGRSDVEVRRIIYSGLLHDIGKSKVPKRIVEKPSKLTDEEYKEMQKHTTFGYQMLNTRPDISKDVALGVLTHHEREDGSGYPNGLKGDEIHLFGKILAVADVYDAMSTNKNYRDKYSPFEVAEQITLNSFGHLDPRVSRIFLDNISKFYVGNTVLLSDGRVGDIIFVNPSDATRPIVKVNDSTFVDLSKEKLKVVDILS